MTRDQNPLTKMATNHSLYLQKPKLFHQTGKCNEEGGLTRGSLNHHHLSLNEHVCIYLSLSETEWGSRRINILLLCWIISSNAIAHQFTYHKRSHPQELFPKEGSNNRYDTHHCKPRTVKDMHDCHLYGILGILPRHVRAKMLWL